MNKAKKYYVSNHALHGLLLHSAGCKLLPPTDSRAFIGSCYSASQALTVAGNQYSHVRLCEFCLQAAKKENCKPVLNTQVTPVLREQKQTVCMGFKIKGKEVKAVKHFPHTG
ncbi:hypothetical protein [Erwinia sp.]|uniref:hypothetical protein n=1 Tax=Erwinia citreus TaxID=558 RepID=UPI003C7519AA